MTSLIVVDMQYDFMPGGSLAVNEGDIIVPIVNEIYNYLSSSITVFTQDFHPSNHVSFHINNPGSTIYKPWVLDSGVSQVMWPVHCVQGSDGAKLHSALNIKPTDKIFQKGTKQNCDSYSGFGSPNMIDENTGLLDYLHSVSIKSVVVVGLATDYCVKATALHAKQYGFQVYLVLSACRGVDVDSTNKSINEMKAAGVVIVNDLEHLKTLI